MLSYVGNFGYGWSSGFSGSKGVFLLVSTQNFGSGNPGYRADGFQLRCLSE
ncbi:hypothetical protein [uncultured Rikenella sp.]|uniref:hypothetical protein n=1 Tax=uncultured Rikenella sp. TaxID=368003 RepID=UPI002602F3F4|nr:hypothetical protein [uncultured Rikenella sp.]